MGALPLYGLHLPLVLLVCLPLRLDVLLAYLAAQISNPLLAPALVALELGVGLRLLGHDALLQAVPDAGLSARALALGSLCVGAALALLGGFSAWVLSRSRRRSGAAAKREEVGETERDAALERTFARYAEAPAAVRGYLAGKLLSDPVTRLVAERAGRRRLALDVGCGYGQVSLMLLELGLVERARGVDRDPRRVELAVAAAGDAARFEVADLRRWEGEPCDLLLVLDVLHALPAQDQRRVTERLAALLVPSGLLVLRTPRTGRGAALTRWLEAVRLRVGGPREAPRFPDPEEVARWLREAGLTVRAVDASRLWFRNVALFAERPADGGPQGRDPGGEGNP